MGIFILRLILDLISLFWKIWDKVPKEVKEKVYEEAANAFEELLRAFYKAYKQSREK